MHNTTKHTPLHKAIHTIPMLYAEAFAGSNNREFVVELYKDAQLLETAAPAMYEALQQVRDVFYTLANNAGDVPEWNEGGELYELSHAVKVALAQAEGGGHE